MGAHQKASGGSLSEARFPLLPLDPFFDEPLKAFLDLGFQLLRQWRAIGEGVFEKSLRFGLERRLQGLRERLLKGPFNDFVNVDGHDYLAKASGGAGNRTRVSEYFSAGVYVCSLSMVDRPNLSRSPLASRRAGLLWG